MAKKPLKGIKQEVESAFTAETGYLYLVRKPEGGGYVQFNGKTYGEDNIWDKGAGTNSALLKNSGNIASGVSSVAEGYYTKTTNLGEHASGSYNVSTSGLTSFSHGIGTDSNNRKNAIEILSDGAIYVFGVGGYDGTNAGVSGAKTLQDVSISMTEITWSSLKALRDGGQLIPGMQYRITDYTCTTTQADTQSANHPFDIIVTADSENTLNENARACLHSGDTYFSGTGANLEPWELKYSLDNDTTKFAWADSGSTGRGVIYWMKDEWNNECPYDFKNIRFSVQPTFEANAYGATNTYTKNGTVINIDNVDYYGYTRTRTAQGYPAPPEQLYVTETVLQTNMSLYTVTNNVATLYTTATVDSVTNVNYEPYTFDSFGEDASMSLTKNCYSNIIGEFINNGGPQELNRIIFRSTVSSGIFNCYSNTIKLNCRNMTFDYGCHSNTFGDGCYDNTFGSGCYGNVIGNGCYNNKFGNNYQYNTFGNKCYSNTFGYDCNYNTFGNQCYSNTFGNSGSYNSFGNNCYYYTI